MRSGEGCRRADLLTSAGVRSLHCEGRGATWVRALHWMCPEQGVVDFLRTVLARVWWLGLLPMSVSARPLRYILPRCVAARKDTQCARIFQRQEARPDDSLSGARIVHRLVEYWVDSRSVACSVRTPRYILLRCVLLRSCRSCGEHSPLRHCVASKGRRCLRILGCPVLSGTHPLTAV
jgi:hypothetical protein